MTLKDINKNDLTIFFPYTTILNIRQKNTQYMHLI